MSPNKKIQSLQNQLTNAQKECKGAKLIMYMANCTGAALSVVTIVALLNKYFEESIISAACAGMLFMCGNNNRNVYHLVQRDIQEIRHKINRAQKQK